MDGGAEPLLRPLPARPRVLRQRSQSAVTKTAATPDAADSDASKRSSRGGHRHTQSHHHIPHHPKRFVKDRLGLQNNGSSLAELSKTASRVSNRPAHEDASASRKDSQSLGLGQGVSGLDGGLQSTLAKVDGEEVERLVLEEQWKNQKRQRELQSTLHALNEESMKTTRRLDDLYYTLLEKLSGLRSTISNLQELAGLTAQLHEQFREDTTELTTDLHRQIEAFGGFKAQQVKIEAIDGRVNESKSKADGLSERLEKARKRVSALEEREKEWQDSVSWRLRWMWTILGTVIGIFFVFGLVHLIGARPVSSAQNPNPEIAKLSLASLTSVPTSVKSVLEDVLGHTINTTVDAYSTPSGMSSMSSRISKLLEPTTPVERDPLLKIFDEL